MELNLAELNLNEIFHYLSMQWQLILIIVIPAIFVLIIAFWLHHQTKPSVKVRRVIRRLGDKYLANVQIPDGMDGSITIDYLVLTEQGVILVGVKMYDGAIYGGELLAKWRQVTNKGSFEFFNPLKEIDIKAKALNALLPEVEIVGLVLFGAKSQFPKTMPENVKHIDEINFETKRFKFNQEIESRWRNLQALSR